MIELRTCWLHPVPQDRPHIAECNRLRFGPDVFTIPVAMMPALRAAIEQAETISRQLANEAA
jgi:hypothetical protein